MLTSRAGYVKRQLPFYLTAGLLLVMIMTGQFLTFQNPDFLLRNPDLLIKNLDFLLKLFDFITKSSLRADGAETAPQHDELLQNGGRIPGGGGRAES